MTFKLFNIYILILLFFVSGTAWAQTNISRKRVLDDTTGEPIAGATINLLPGGVKLVSDDKGYFTIPPEYDAHEIGDLEVAAMGYKAQRQPFLSLDSIISLREDIFNLEEVVVTATRTPKLLDAVPIYTHVIRSQDIKNMGAPSLTNILERELPGIEFKTHFNQVQVDMQGFGAGSLLFLINGERIAIGEQSNVDYLRIPPQDIERIEIIKGAASALYGSNAVGGVVNIITKKVNKPLSVLLDNQYRSTKEYQIHFSLGTKITKDLDSRTSISRQKLGGYYIPFRDEEVQGVDTTYNYNVNQTFSYVMADNLKLSLSGAAFKRRRFESDPRLASFFEGYRTSLTGTYSLNDATTVSGSYMWDYYSKYIFNKTTPRYNYGKDGDDKIHSLRLQASHNFSKDNILVIGSEYLHETFEKKNQVKEQKSADVLSVYAQHDMALFQNLNVVYGVRLDKHSTFGVHLSPKLSLMYKWNRFTFRGTYSNSFSAPTIKQLYMDFNHSGGGIAVFKMIGNKDLKPQTSHDFNFSTEYTNGAFNMSIMGFHNRFSNKIVEHWMRKEGQGLVIQWDNSGTNSSVTGAEARLRVRLPYHLSFRGGYTYSYVYNPIIIPSGEKTANQSYTRPHMATANLEYNQQINSDWGLYASLWGKLGSKLEYDQWSRTEIEKLTTEGYVLLNAQARLRYREHIECYVEAANITNYIPSSYTFNAPLVVGRNLMIGLQLKY